MKKALVVVDFQNDFVSGSLGFPEASNLEDKINTKISDALRNNYDLFFTMDTHFPNYLQTKEGKNLPIIHCQKGSFGNKLVSSTAAFLPKAKKVFEKSNFASVELAEYLKNQNYHIIELVGLVSNICVLANAVLIKSFLPESDIVVDASCCASFNKELHYKAMDVLEGLQVDIIGK